MHTHQSCFSKSWRMGWSWSASKSSNRAAISNWPVVWRGLGYLKIVSHVETWLFFFRSFAETLWVKNEKKSQSADTICKNVRELHFHFFVSTFHIHPYHSSATMSKSRHPEEVVQQPQDPKSLIHLTLRTMSFWNWQTHIFFAYVSLPRRCWKFVQPSESDSMATQQWTSGRVPIVPSWMFWQESQHLSEIGDQAPPATFPLAITYPWTWRYKAPKAICGKTATPEAQIRETTDSWLLQKWSHQIGGRSRHAMRKATLKSRDFTLLIQLFGEFNDRSVDVGVSKYTS